jgi:paraquat-inducible protein B
MSRGRKASPELIGAFVLGAAALAVAAVAVFGSGRLFRRQLQAVAYFGGSVNGLSAGAPVKFRGMPIGTVSEIRFRRPPPTVASPADLRIPVWLEIDLDQLSTLRGERTTIDHARFEQLIAAGLRAQLQTESFVTGVLFVGIDYFPGSPVVLVHPDDPTVFEIPTMPTTLEQAFATLEKVMHRLDQVDIEGLVASATRAFDGVSTLSRSPAIDETLASLRETLASVRGVTDSLQPTVKPTMQELRQALARLGPQLEKTLDRLQGLTDPRAPLAVGLVQTLADLGEAARAVTALVDYLDRHPNAILTGRPGS